MTLIAGGVTLRVLIEDGVHSAWLPPAHIDSRARRIKFMNPMLQAVPPLWPAESKACQRTLRHCCFRWWGPRAVQLLAAISVLVLIPHVAGRFSTSRLPILSVNLLPQAMTMTTATAMPHTAPLPAPSLRDRTPRSASCMLRPTDRSGR